LAFEQLVAEPVERFEEQAVKVLEVVADQAMVYTSFYSNGTHRDRSMALADELSFRGVE